MATPAVSFFRSGGHFDEKNTIAQKMSPETVQRKVIKSSTGISDKTNFEAEGTIPQMICNIAAIVIKIFIDFLELDSWLAPKGRYFFIFIGYILLAIGHIDDSKMKMI